MSRWLADCTGDRSQDRRTGRWPPGRGLVWPCSRVAAAAGAGAVGAVAVAVRRSGYGRDLARVLTVDLITHTWDLARAVGAQDTMDAEVVAVVLPVVELIGPLLSASGEFGSPISVPETESAQRRLLGRLGRASGSV